MNFFNKDPNLLANWLSQFDVDDQPHANQLLEELVYITLSEMRDALTKAIIDRGNEIAGPVGLYAERHVRHHSKKPTRLFVKETVTQKNGVKSRRAEGIGPDPVVSQRRHAHDTGSEALIAQLITQICKANPKKFLDHPGPMHIRPKKVRSFILVTDFIGSGQRVISYLNAAWRVKSVRSWWSLKLLNFEVVSFAGTVQGIERVRTLKCGPTVRTVKGCPVLSDLSPDQSFSLSELCKKYGPKIKSWKTTPLGYGNTGALMVFEHGAPNNMPYLLHGASKNWIPLFSQRTTFQTSKVSEFSLAESRISQRLKKLGRERLEHLNSLQQFSQQTQETALVLTALRRYPRTIEAVSSKTGLTTFEVEDIIDRAKASGLLTNKLQPTDKAFAEIKYLRNSNKKNIFVHKGDNSLYFPNMLRPPSENI